MNKLRIIRIIVAIIIFIAALGTLLNIFPADSIAQYALEIQFTPALMGVLTGSFIFILAILIITFLFGRVYCSFICPLGIFQDIIYFFSRRILKKTNKEYVKKNSRYKTPLNILRYTILLIIMHCFALGITLPVSLLDPYSIFGRISNNIIVYIGNGLNNLSSYILPDAYYYQEYAEWSLYSFVYSVIILVVIITISSLKGRLYCNSICPVGSFLGLISQNSLFKIAINKEMCISCTQCSRNCKSNCIDLKNKEIDYTRCVMCFDCITNCARGGVKVVPAWKMKKDEAKANAVQEAKKIENKGRRSAIIAMGGLVGAVAFRKYVNPSNILSGVEYEPNTRPILPPGARGLEKFMSACTSCHACIEACPSNIIKPASYEYGIDGIMMPTLKYTDGYCKYNCNACSDVCPNEALIEISLEQKQRTKIGVAHFIAQNCISLNEGIDCGACSRECPVGAIKMVKSSKNPSMEHPRIARRSCIGCGACEYVCPALPKAIRVSGVR